MYIILCKADFYFHHLICLSISSSLIIDTQFMNFRFYTTNSSNKFTLLLQHSNTLWQLPKLHRAPGVCLNCTFNFNIRKNTDLLGFRLIGIVIWISIFPHGYFYRHVIIPVQKIVAMLGSSNNAIYPNGEYSPIIIQDLNDIFVHSRKFFFSAKKIVYHLLLLLILPNIVLY